MWRTIGAILLVVLAYILGNSAFIVFRNLVFDIAEHIKYSNKIDYIFLSIAPSLLLILIIGGAAYIFIKLAFKWITCSEFENSEIPRKQSNWALGLLVTSAIAAIIGLIMVSMGVSKYVQSSTIGPEPIPIITWQFIFSYILFAKSNKMKPLFRV